MSVSLNESYVSHPGMDLAGGISAAPNKTTMVKPTVQIPGPWDLDPGLPYHLLEDPDRVIGIGQGRWWFHPNELDSVPESFREDVLRSCRPLVAFAGERLQFVGEIGGRGLRGNHRTLCLRNLRIFGQPTVVADHLWVEQTRVWDVAEPLLQGTRIALDATVTRYARPEVREFRHGSIHVRVEGDAGLLVHKVFAFGDTGSASQRSTRAPNKYQ